METLQAILNRRTIRAFTDEKVSDENLKTIAEAGACAPSAMNRQALQITVLTNAKLLQELNESIGSSVDSETCKRVVSRNSDGKFNCMYHAPALIIVSASGNALFPREDTACAIENMYLAATDLNLGACWINQLSNGISEQSAARKTLNAIGVPSDNKVYGCLAVGHIAQQPSAKNKSNVIVYCK